MRTVRTTSSGGAGSVCICGEIVVTVRAPRLHAYSTVCAKIPNALMYVIHSYVANAPRLSTQHTHDGKICADASHCFIFIVARYFDPHMRRGTLNEQRQRRRITPQRTQSSNNTSHPASARPRLDAMSNPRDRAPRFANVYRTQKPAFQSVYAHYRTTRKQLHHGLCCILYNFNAEYAYKNVSGNTH